MTTTAAMIARQQPLASPFGYRSSASEVLAGHDLTGQRAIVTGGYSGLGLETVKALTAAGATVVVPARRPETAAQALAGVQGVTVAPMDLGDLDSVAAFTADIRAAGTPINLLITVAGVMASPYTRTPQGWESQFGINHLGHFALVGGVADVLADGARVVSYSSVAHYRSPVLFDDLNFESTPYDPWVAYGQAKTANALFGGIMTDLQRHMPHEELVARGWVDADGNPNPLFKTPEQGASTGLWAAIAPELADRGGVYTENCAIMGIVPPDHADLSTGGVKEWAINAEYAERLWDLSVKATGLTPLG